MSLDLSQRIASLISSMYTRSLCLYWAFHNIMIIIILTLAHDKQ